MSLAGVVDRYSERDSPVHRADARAKVPAAFAYILVISATREADWAALGLLAVPVLAVVLASRLGPWLVLRRTFLALPFVLAAVPLVFTRPGETVFTLPLLGWTASDEGIRAVATILARHRTVPPPRCPGRRALRLSRARSIRCASSPITKK